MKAWALCGALCMALVVVSHQAPLPDDSMSSMSSQQDGLIRNVELQADEAVRAADDKARRYNAEAAQAEATMQANKKFAQDGMATVATAVNGLNEMEAKEQQVNEDMQTIETDVQKLRSAEENREYNRGLRTGQDLMAKDQDARQNTQEIDSAAADVDNSLGQLQSDMSAANVPTGAGKLAAEQTPQHTSMLSKDLGESNRDMPYAQRLSEVEEQSNAAVSAAQNDEMEAKTHWQNDMNELTRESSQAGDAFQQLQKAKARLDNDLNGHKDKRLERDIQDKLADIERIESPAAGGEQDAQEPAPQSAPSWQDPQPPPVLGESHNDIPPALQAAEQQAEQAAMNQVPMEPTPNSVPPPMDSVDTQAPADVPMAKHAPEGPPDTPMAADPAPPAEMYQQSRQSLTTQQTGQDEVYADLDAINKDAQGLEQYQGQATQEMEKVKQRLQPHD